METLNKIKLLSLQYLCGIIFSWGTMLILGILLAYILIWFVNYFNSFFSDGYGDFIGGIGIRIGMFVTIPVGASLGIVFINKMLSNINSNGQYIWKILAAFSMGVLGSAFVYWILPLFFGEAVFGWFPPIGHMYITFRNESFLIVSPLFALIGYNAVEYLAYKKKEIKKMV